MSEEKNWTNRLAKRLEAELKDVLNSFSQDLPEKVTVEVKITADGESLLDLSFLVTKREIRDGQRDSYYEFYLHRGLKKT